MDVLMMTILEGKLSIARSIHTFRISYPQISLHKCSFSTDRLSFPRAVLLRSFPKHLVAHLLQKHIPQTLARFQPDQLIDDDVE